MPSGERALAVPITCTLAASRGASAAAVKTIEQNLARAKVEGRVRQQDVFAFLRTTQSTKPYRIVFADPPYEKTKSGGQFTQLLLESQELACLLETSGTFVLEKRPSEKIPSAPLWDVVRARRYGATEVLFLQRANAPAETRSRS